MRKCPHCNSSLPISKRREAYDFRKTYMCNWDQVASAVGYSTGNSARVAAKQYAEESGESYPLPKSSKGACIYVARKSGHTWQWIASQYQKTILEVQRQAQMWAKRHKRSWPPSKQ